MSERNIPPELLFLHRSNTEGELTLEEEAQLYKLQIMAKELSPEQLIRVAVLFYRDIFLERHKVARLMEQQSIAMMIILLLLSAIALMYAEHTRLI